WGMIFGNGVALGDADALYWAAGPNTERDGTFGAIRLTSRVKPVVAGEPQDQALAAADATATFVVDAPCPAPVNYQWQMEASDGRKCPLRPVERRRNDHEPGCALPGGRQRNERRRWKRRRARNGLEIGRID